jgi:hypothetical protein
MRGATPGFGDGTVIEKFRVQSAIAAVFDLAQTHQFLAANDKTNLTPRCFKQAYRNVLRNLDQERKDAEKDLALPQLVRAKRDLALAEKASAAAALQLVLNKRQQTKG